MKCQLCGRNEATVLYTHIADSEKTSALICDSCAAVRHAAAADCPAPETVPLPPAKVTIELARAPETPESGVCCPNCAMTYADFRKRGRFGCHACYDSFGGELERLMRRIHGADQHCGKGLVPRLGSRPAAVGLVELQHALAQAVASEAYEQAAQLRDRIRALESAAEGRDVSAAKPENGAP
jgi:protein arginine kinase activator